MGGQLRLEHFLCFSDAPSVDEHAAEYRSLGFVPQAHAARWEPGLHNRFIGLWPEYLELVWVEDEAAFAASDDPIRRHRAGRRPFGVGILSEDLSALHAEWAARGLDLPEISYESPAGSDPDAGPMFAFVAIPQHLLPGVDGFGLTSYCRPTSPTRHQVWVAPNSLFGLAGLTLVSDEAAGDAEAWRWLLAPDQVVRDVAGGHDLLVGVHRLTWLTPDAYTERYGLRWEPTAGGAGALALFELLALDLERLERYAAAAGAPVRRLTDGALLLKPSAHDGFRLVVRQGELAEWVGWRDERLGVEHEVVRMDEFMARGTPGNGEYVLRRATLDDLDAIRRLGREVLPETYGPILPQGYVDMLLERYWSDEANATAIESSAEELLVAESPTTGVLGIAHRSARGGHRDPVAAVSPAASPPAGYRLRAPRRVREALRTRHRQIHDRVHRRQP
ncbi:hypothetical protein BH24CHL7_BH24CHL7_14780 [soil metagenome]